VIFQPLPQMDFQPKYRPEGESAFFADGRAMRPQVAGTIAQGELPDEGATGTGKEDGGFVAVAPVAVDRALVLRGQERFGIFCAPCHDATGRGHGAVVQHGYPLATDLTGDRVRGLPDGEIFNVVTHGVRNMPAYALQIPAADRWAIVAWVRVLEQAQHSSIDDVPPELRGQIQPEKKQ
jgi:mono/diheme cytochrome c family protein